MKQRVAAADYFFEQTRQATRLYEYVGQSSDGSMHMQRIATRDGTEAVRMTMREQRAAHDRLHLAGKLTWGPGKALSSIKRRSTHDCLRQHASSHEVIDHLQSQAKKAVLPPSECVTCREAHPCWAGDNGTHQPSNLCTGDTSYAPAPSGSTYTRNVTAMPSTSLNPSRRRASDLSY